MERKMKANRCHVVIVPYPGQASEVRIETISDGFDEIGWCKENGGIYLESFKNIGSQTLKVLMKKYENSCNPVTCIVDDSILHWVLDVAKELGLLGASFFTQSSSVSSIYHHVCQGNMNAPVLEPRVCIPGLPLLVPRNFPSYVADLEPSSAVVLNQADYVLINTFNKLESEVVSWMSKQYPVKTIGPTTPSMYLDKRIESGDDYGLNLFNPSGKACIEWLNKKEISSVIYVSFGSIVSWTEEQMEEVAWGLRDSTKNFLWIVRETEQVMLPTDFLKETSGKGLVVEWCCQLEVLAHQLSSSWLAIRSWTTVLLTLRAPTAVRPETSLSSSESSSSSSSSDEELFRRQVKLLHEYGKMMIEMEEAEEKEQEATSSRRRGGSKRGRIDKQKP
ncbi:hypothetical protein GIB67_008071 [Kingdonia uniflora]|uniref:Uncharacterized protein n=1 Tax=Kingdonia uniflora TaxID=39325 RepID=A0A7J7MCZ6_9MAGN|nr:hypothetical protein GIB67_008071 [Kingdonia uniflora]